jgi:cysteine desulfurase/selenocysteine lyase
MSTVSPWKHDFPIFASHAHPNLCYLDSAATCLTPKHVADAVYYYQCFSHANSHKGLYRLSAHVTELVEQARGKTSQFVNALSHDEIIFTSGTTEAINMVANSYLRPLLTQTNAKQKNIVISAAEHHANLIPWQQLCIQTGAQLRIVDLGLDGTVDLTKLAQLLDSDTVFCAVNHISNILGIANPIQKICQLAHKKNIPVLVDGAQAVLHGPVDMQKLGCDFYVFSAHKLYGPTGCGILYIKGEYQEQMMPAILGGGIVASVDYHQSEFISGALKFESGSHNVASIVGLVEALDYLQDISWLEVNQYLNKLSRYMQKSLNELDFIKPLMPELYHHATIKNATPSLASFSLKGVHCHDVASLLDNDDIAVRAGHHCVQPFHKKLGINASIRASVALYNGFEDIDRLIDGLTNAHQLMTVSDETSV